MSFYLKVSGAAETFVINQDIIKQVQFRLDSDNNTQTRANDYMIDLKINGQFTDEQCELVGKLAKWATLRSGDVYRKAELQYAPNDNTVMREYIMTTAFVVDYSETFGGEGSEGLFELILRQKRDKLDEVKINSNFPFDVDAMS